MTARILLCYNFHRSRSSSHLTDWNLRNSIQTLKQRLWWKPFYAQTMRLNTKKQEQVWSFFTWQWNPDFNFSWIRAERSPWELTTQKALTPVKFHFQFTYFSGVLMSNLHKKMYCHNRGCKSPSETIVTRSKAVPEKTIGSQIVSPCHNLPKS